MGKHIKHKHHIVPKHAGGNDNRTNIIELTVAEHAEAHRVLFEKYGRLEDKVAWKGLAGLISSAEAVHLLQTEGMRGERNPMYGKPAPNRGMKRPGIGGRKKGTKWSAKERANQESMRATKEHKDKMSAVYADTIRNSKISKNSKGKVGAARGKKWFNNGVDEKYFEPGQQPIGWNRGRINKK